MPCLRSLVLAVLAAVGALAVPLHDAAGQATPAANPLVSAQSTPLLVTALGDPLRVTGSDGMTHLEYDLLLTNVFAAPVTLTTIVVRTPEGRSLMQLEGDSLTAVTQPLLGRTPTAQIPPSGTVAVVLDVVVTPDQVPQRLTHRIDFALPADAPLATIIDSEQIVGPELMVNPFTPIVIAPPLRGNGWINANGCCDPSDHRSFRLAIDGAHIVTPEMFAIEWMQIDGGRLYAGDGARNEDYFAFGEDVLAVADGTVVFVRDGITEDTPNQLVMTLHRPLDYGGNEVILAIAPGVYALYAHLQPGGIRVQVGEKTTNGQPLGLLSNTGNSSAPHLHFGLLDAPDGLLGNSLPFVLDAWTLAGTPDPDSSAADVRLVGEPQRQHATLPLDMTVADFS